MAKTEVSRWSRVVGSQLHTQSIDVDKKDDHGSIEMDTPRRDARFFVEAGAFPTLCSYIPTTPIMAYCLHSAFNALLGLTTKYL